MEDSDYCIRMARIMRKALDLTGKEGMFPKWYAPNLPIVKANIDFLVGLNVVNRIHYHDLPSVTCPW